MASACFGLVYYLFYWQYRDLFREGGRYFDEANQVVHHSQASVSILPALVFLLLAILLAGVWWARRRCALGGSRDGP